MKLASQIVVCALVSVAILVCCGCPGIFPGGVADIGTPAPCNADVDCPDGISCIFANEGDESGFCDVDETQVTTGTPAPCNANEDCPEGIGCVLANEGDETGFCDIEEMLAP